MVALVSPDIAALFSVAQPSSLRDQLAIRYLSCDTPVVCEIQSRNGVGTEERSTRALGFGSAELLIFESDQKVHVHLREPASPYMLL